jgi:carbon monoxide dehydrogenase subunit G
MEVTNTFRVNAPERRAWDVITDVERIAPMLPGVVLEEVDGAAFRGGLKVKIGRVRADYRGTASFLERNEADGRVVLKASGRDSGGQGNASVILTATLAPEGDGTTITIVAELTTTGKVAQFGRQVLTDVSDRVILQFIEAFEADLERDHPRLGEPGGSVADAEIAAPDGSAPEGVLAVVDAGGAPPGPAEGARPAAETAVPPVERPEPEPVDLLDTAGGSPVKRLVPLLGGLGALILALLIGRSRRSR